MIKITPTMMEVINKANRTGEPQNLPNGMIVTVNGRAEVYASATVFPGDGVSPFSFGGWMITNEPPPPSVAPDVAFYTDDAEWTDAVARDGVDLHATDEYFQSTHWELLKAELLTGACALCSRRGVALTLHHRHYANLGAEQLGRDVTEICWICHGRQHQRMAA